MSNKLINLEKYFKYFPQSDLHVKKRHVKIDINVTLFDFLSIEEIRRKFCTITDQINYIDFVDITITCKHADGPGCILLLELLICFLLESDMSLKVYISISYDTKYTINNCISKSIIYRYNNNYVNNEQLLNDVLHNELHPYCINKPRHPSGNEVINYLTGKQTSLERELVPLSPQEWIKLNFFRSIVSSEDITKLSTLSTNLRFYFKSVNCLFEKDVIKNALLNEIITIISELVGNATEHAESDCIVYCSVDPALDKNKKDCILIAICIINLSNIKLYTKILEKIKHSPNEINEKVNKAKQLHQKHFSNKYTLEHFGMIANFQKEVSTRYDIENGTGGTGLPTFINKIEGLIDDEYCYVASGNSAIFFEHKYTKLENGEVGFNEKCRFIDDVPNESVLRKIPFLLNGTMYNIHLIINKE